VVEEWKQCCDGRYAISNHGRFRREVRGVSTHAGRLLKPMLLKTGYYYVNPVVDGRNKPFTIHSLVAEHFIGKRPEGMEVNHIDGCKTNNRVDNLEYVTHGDNMRHAFRTKLVDHEKTRVHSDELIASVREARERGDSFASIARQYGMSIAYVYSACRSVAARTRGMKVIGGDIQKPKVTEADVVRLRERRAEGARCKDLAVEFGISETQVSAICVGLKWKRAGGPLTRTKV